MEEPKLYIDYLSLRESSSGYASPRSRISYLARTGRLIRVRRGLYVPADTRAVSRLTLANKIYGPSYVSFETALAHHGLIPERTHTITSASMGKNKSKAFHTPLGEFTYRSVPSTIFPYGIARADDPQSPYLMATPEKALCDLIAKAGKAVSKDTLERFLLDDLRIDPEALARLNAKDVAMIAGIYDKRPVHLLCEYLKGRRRGNA